MLAPAALLGEGSEEKQNEDLPHFVSLTYQLYTTYSDIIWRIWNLKLKVNTKEK